ncbi:TIGR02680 family protein [Reyranella sp.]|uniref:TIGR02680 family protein n=1 Tax=Reyranella sp. TaxID=1929291 RepID=UPI00271EA9DD|nr:TIGR02680 family protein [Reyranella sp.]MDO8974437.1 TIGR02680 family protein [Reyranella sp.]
MNDSFFGIEQRADRPTLPVPTQLRWQPLRLGVVELFHYDSEEFWFRDGHLLLRGNNGTGKSKVLSLTLPFLLDAQLKPSRVEPDGDGAKKMAWNLLMNGYSRRMGYAWIEFGRRTEDGTPRYLTLGAGLSAKEGRPQVESWYFVLDDAAGVRLNHDLWLTSPQRIVLTRERLREALEGRGQVFDNAGQYRRAVDERLFRLGAKRYDALMDTLIQLRQPQLSKKPDENGLSNALTEALPPMPSELLGDVADALNQLEEDRRQLEEYQHLARAIGQFEQRYRAYSGTQSRRQARSVRQAQTEFDNASRARGEAQGRLQVAQSEEAQAQARHADADTGLKGARERRDTLLADPAMQDANRLETALRDSTDRKNALDDASQGVEQANRRLQHRIDETARSERLAREAEERLATARREIGVHADSAGISAAYAENGLSYVEAAVLVALAPTDFEKARAALSVLVRGRSEQVALLRGRHAEVERAELRHAHRRQLQDEQHDEADAAAQRREQADTDVEHQGSTLVTDWERYLATFDQLAVEPDEIGATLAALAEWVIALQGESPARLLLQAAQQGASKRFAERTTALEAQRQTLLGEHRDLLDEQDRLEAGISPAPPAPHTRGADVRLDRLGAPLWQLVDFHDTVSPEQRASIEAGLEAAGLLDAWVSPDGRLQIGVDGRLSHDMQLLERPALAASLAAWLRPATPEGSPVSVETIERILAAIACTGQDTGEHEAWVSPEGRFRLGGLAGAWAKPAAVYVGHAAREFARRQRLAEIAERLRQLSDQMDGLQAAAERLAADRRSADEEWRRAPADDTLRGAHATAAACAREVQRTREKLAEADRRCIEAIAALKAARDRLAADAADLRLPVSSEALVAIEAALDRYRDILPSLLHAAHELRLAVPDLNRQRQRELEALTDKTQSEERLTKARNEAVQAATRFEVLRDTVGARVEELQRKLGDARLAVDAGEVAVKQAHEALRLSGEARAIAAEKFATAEATLQERTTNRSETVARLQSFARTGLLSSALPEIELPDMSMAWTIDPALTLARRIEQALSGLRDDDEAWNRVQRQINEELTELQRALSALGHRASGDTSDWGLVVSIVYQNQAERPDRLALRLGEEIAQRSELLTAKERAVLENHLQAEIAAEIQRLLTNAEKQRDAINRELHKRPTSTGVRYRLLWQPLAEEEGAPLGLEAARKRLLNTSADLWSAEDRNVVGTMLQRRIATERERADAGAGRDGSLVDQLARALDYRRWHRFRVERWQDGQWRKLSGPASSGERALGLTVPLFAAVASFYSQGAYPLAPRLILLDEAFAGIDDAARAHCMGLIREFDLDFVITSEREWACYAELPGVAICQLQRREGVDAVFVSRWTWDGRARLRQADPDRRFSPA